MKVTTSTGSVELVGDGAEVAGEALDEPADPFAVGRVAQFAQARRRKIDGHHRIAGPRQGERVEARPGAALHDRRARGNACEQRRQCRPLVDEAGAPQRDRRSRRSSARSRRRWAFPLERLAAETGAAQAAAGVEHEPARARRCRRTADRGGRRTARRGRRPRSLRPSSRRAGSAARGARRRERARRGRGRRRRARASCSAIVIAGDSRQSLVPGLYASPSSRMREPLTARCSLFSIEMTRLDDVVGHAAVDVVRELDEAEAVPELPFDAPREVRRIDRAGSDRRRPARA